MAKLEFSELLSNLKTRPSLSSFFFNVKLSGNNISENINDQFVLGADVLVAPVMEQGAVQRLVVLPKGDWLYCDGKKYMGGQTVSVSAPIEMLPYFTRI